LYNHLGFLIASMEYSSHILIEIIEKKELKNITIEFSVELLYKLLFSREGFIHAIFTSTINLSK